jgi:hypothetical protein
MLILLFYFHFGFIRINCVDPPVGLLLNRIERLGKLPVAVYSEGPACARLIKLCLFSFFIFTSVLSGLTALILQWGCCSTKAEKLRFYTFLFSLRF